MFPTPIVEAMFFFSGGYAATILVCFLIVDVAFFSPRETSSVLSLISSILVSTLSFTTNVEMVGSLVWPFDPLLSG